MIELPEALVIARQMTDEIAGKRILEGNKGNSPHKFAFDSGTEEDYAAILQDKTVGQTQGHGMAILTPIGDDHVLVLGGGGERILYHESERSLPRKRQLLLHFDDGTYLTVTVSGWGNTLLLPRKEYAHHGHVALDRTPPLTPGFTWDYFQELLAQVREGSSASAKYFLVSKPGVWGIGNGCMQDILYHAKIHPRRPMIDTTPKERRVLYDAIQTTLGHIVELGGRSSERDLYGKRGRYQRILDSKTKGQPCPTCGTEIEKAQYLGGAIYFCPTCQT